MDATNRSDMSCFWGGYYRTFLALFPPLSLVTVLSLSLSLSLPHSLTLPLCLCFMYRHQPAIAKFNDFQRCQTDVILVVFISHKYSHYSMRIFILKRACTSHKLVLIGGISLKYPIQPPIANLMFWEVGFKVV